MRILKKPVSFCLSLFSPEFSRPFDSRISFYSGFHHKIPNFSFAKPKQIHTAGFDGGIGFLGVTLERMLEDT
ncbi:unnamed protein product [Dovyalis caffra]|uniref:Uncharacterized protein n=1 Tax=Dovyalis caffra TaxID=77055 RepID=A0AAV1SGA9_9ROSI|nr:unnamed protein product [Dovyalis caffra]